MRESPCGDNGGPVLEHAKAKGEVSAHASDLGAVKEPDFAKLEADTTNPSWSTDLAGSREPSVPASNAEAIGPKQARPTTEAAALNLPEDFGNISAPEAAKPKGDTDGLRQAKLRDGRKTPTWQIPATGRISARPRFMLPVMGSSKPAHMSALRNVDGPVWQDCRTGNSNSVPAQDFKSRKGPMDGRSDAGSKNPHRDLPGMRDSTSNLARLCRDKDGPNRWVHETEASKPMQARDCRNTKTPEQAVDKVLRVESRQVRLCSSRNKPMFLELGSGEADPSLVSECAGAETPVYASVRTGSVDPSRSAPDAGTERPGRAKGCKVRGSSSRTAAGTNVKRSSLARL